MTATLLRPGALDGRVVVADGAYAAACAAAGASIATGGAERIDMLVVDAARTFGAGGLGGLRAALDGAWTAVRVVATQSWLQERGAATGATLVFVAPRADAGEHADAAAAALENLARTLAVEWARFGVRATAIAPGPRTADGEIAALVAVLASAAGGYFSGCRFDLR